MTVHSKFRLRIVDIHPCPRAIVFSCHYLYNFRFRPSTNENAENNRKKQRSILPYFSSIHVVQPS